MKVIKPQKLGLLCRTFEHRRRVHLAVTVLAFFRLDPPRSLLPETSLWKMAAAELGKDAALDVGFPKARPEILITGNAYPPAPRPRQACSARVQLGPVDKTLYIAGDRTWSQGAPTEPEPFAEMPITYARAFGGPGFAPNPAGKGIARIQGAQGEIHPLPNIEHPDQLLRSPDDRPLPASFGPCDLTWPERLSRAGTYDREWLEQRYPGLPDDLDLSFYNTAPPDQQLAAPLRGDEPFTLENLHPDKAVLELRLPGIATRAFIDQATPDGEVFREVPLALETVHLFPHIERGILLFRGLVDVLDEDADDVLRIVLAAEALGEPRQVEHYREVLARRLDRAQAHLHALRDDELLPPAAPSAPAEQDPDTAEMTALLAREGLIEQHARRRMEIELANARERLREQGLDPDAHLPAALPPPEPPPDLEALPQIIAGAQAEAERRREEAERRRAEAEAQARAICQEHGLDFDEIMRRERDKAGGPPKFSAAAHIEHLRDVAEMARNAGLTTPELDAQLADPALEAKLVAAETRLRETYMRFAHQLPPARRLAGEEAERARRDVLAGRDARTSLRGRDLTGADLSGLDLRGVDLREALLEHADLSGSDLAGADLTGAVLARADLTGADLTGAKLAGANLGLAILRGAKAGGGVDLSGATLAQADLTGADLSGARLDRADLGEAIFNDTDLRNAIAPELTLLSSDLSGVTLAGADLRKCNLLQVTLTGVDCSGARLASAVLYDVKGDGAIFRGADLENVRLVQGCSFERADFRSAVLDRATLRGGRFAGADFSEARLDGADLSGCDLRGARFYRAVARESRFVKADLSGASLVAANLMHALLPRAIVRGADFRGANLFRADLLRIRVDGATTMEGAELTDIRFVEARGPNGPA